jgi:hypothetical protein
MTESPGPGAQDYPSDWPETYCNLCGVAAATKNVALHQNIGMLVLRQSKTVEGQLCRRCIRSHFWEFTLVTLFAGWWGVISFLFTPFILINNVVRFVGSLGLPEPDPRALSVFAVEPFGQEIAYRLNRGEGLEDVAALIAPRASVRPKDVLAFIRFASRGGL